MRQNFASFAADEIASLFSSSQISGTIGECKGVSTDTRSLSAGNAFVALRGEKFDGHTCIDEAIEKGAAFFVTQHDRLHLLSDSAKNRPHVVVDDSLAALGRLANAYRKRFALPVIAIGGSAGKTTTKDLVAHVLALHGPTLSTEANYNNRIGVPLTLFQLSADHQYCVLELGTSEPGEIAILTEMVEPTHALLTNIGREHLEKLIDLDNVEREETEMFRWVEAHGGHCFVNCEDPRLARYRGKSWAIPFGLQGSQDLDIEYRFDENLHPSLRIHSAGEWYTATMQTIGLPSLYSAVAATAVARSLGLGPALIVRGLETFEGPYSASYARMGVEHIRGITVLNDSYNSNPDSLSIALQTLALFGNERNKVAILGDMRELGADAVALHAEQLKQAIEVCQVVYLVGDLFDLAFQHLEEPDNARVFRSVELMMLEVNDLIGDGDVVLVKASRGVRIERVIEQMRSYDTRQEL